VSPIYKPSIAQQAQEEMIEAAMPKNPLDGLAVSKTPERRAPSGKRPSAKQLKLILKLLGEKELNEGLQKYAGKTAAELEQELTGGWGGTASQIIDALFKAPKKAAAAVQREEAPEGIHYLDGKVYKVQVAVHGSGRKYVKQLDAEAGGWEYLGRNGVFHKLSENTLMTLEDAASFGKLYGMCCVCGATLTDEGSISAGIGPVCRDKLA